VLPLLDNLAELGYYTHVEQHLDEPRPLYFLLRFAHRDDDAVGLPT
jgi:hypothetical protein